MKLGFFIHEGNLTFTGALLFVLLGFGLSYLSLRYLSFTLLKVVGLSIGLAIAAIGGFSGRARSLELKPFTNDPFGWRKAKASYPKKDVEEELKQLSVNSNSQDRNK